LLIIPVGLILVGAPGFRLRSNTGDVVLSTLAAVAALFAVGVAGRYVNTFSDRAIQLLAVALMFRAFAAMLLSVGPALLGLGRSGPALTADLVSAMVGAALMTLAAFSPTVRGLRFPLRGLMLLASVAAVAVAAGGVAIAAGWPHVSRALEFNSFEATVPEPSLVLCLEAGTVVLFLLASYGFWIRSEGEERYRCTDALALSCALGAWAQTYYLVASRGEGWVSLGDLLAVGSSIALAVWAVRELGYTGRRERELAAHTERQRLARELHDSVAQDLAFIVRQTRRLSAAFPHERTLTHISLAAEQALQDSRFAIDRLRADRVQNLSHSIRKLGSSLADRSGVALELDVDEGVACPAGVEHALLSILREAASNTARHAAARRLSVSLKQDESTIAMRISDDGRGFDPAVVASTSTGVGLWSMQERALAYGGQLSLSSRPAEGTAIEIVVPRVSSRLDDRT
jgi:signal transduction histidine kinase